MSAARHASRQEMIQYDEALEGKLFATLNPVQANPEFVTSLKTRLTSSPAVTMERREDLAAVVVIGSGLFAGVFLTWLVFFVRYLLGRRRTA